MKIKIKKNYEDSTRATSQSSEDKPDDSNDESTDSSDDSILSSEKSLVDNDISLSTMNNENAELQEHPISQNNHNIIRRSISNEFQAGYVNNNPTNEVSFNNYLS